MKYNKLITDDFERTMEALFLQIKPYVTNNEKFDQNQPEVFGTSFTYEIGYDSKIKYYKINNEEVNSEDFYFFLRKLIKSRSVELDVFWNACGKRAGVSLQIHEEQKLSKKGKLDFVDVNDRGEYLEILADSDAKTFKKLKKNCFKYEGNILLVPATDSYLLLNKHMDTAKYHLDLKGMSISNGSNVTLITIPKIEIEDPKGEVSFMDVVGDENQLEIVLSSDERTYQEIKEEKHSIKLTADPTSFYHGLCLPNVRGCLVSEKTEKIKQYNPFLRNISLSDWKNGVFKIIIPNKQKIYFV